MSRVRALLLRLMPLVIFSIPMSAATACTLDTVPNWHGYYAEGWPETAQTITPPVQCPKIIEYAFELSPRNSPGKIVFSIYEWSHFGPVGSALFSTTMRWGIGAHHKTVFTVTNINLILTPGVHYGFVIDLLGYTGRSVAFQNNQGGYPGGDAYFGIGDGWAEYAGTNHKFRAVFAAP